MAALLFVPAGTVDYWQAWIFMAVFATSSTAITVYLAVTDPKLLERRMRAGPAAETEATQKIVISVIMAGFVGLLVLAGLDRRFGWSRVPDSLTIAGNGLIAFGFFLMLFVMRANPYSASTIQIADDQKVISTGPYAIVRHPMYAAAVPLLLGIPLALASWWAFVPFAMMTPAFAFRIRDEERFLSRNLPGYVDYMRRVRHRIVPGVW